MKKSTILKANLLKMFHQFEQVEVNGGKVSVSRPNFHEWPPDLTFVFGQTMPLYPDDTPINPLRPLRDRNNRIEMLVSCPLAGEVGVLFGDFTALNSENSEPDESGSVDEDSEIAGVFELCPIHNANEIMIVRKWDMRDDPDGGQPVELQNALYRWDNHGAHRVKGTEIHIISISDNVDSDLANIRASVREGFDNLQQRIYEWCELGDYYLQK